MEDLQQHHGREDVAMEDDSTSGAVRTSEEPESPEGTKLSPRMLHELSFGSTSLTSGGLSRRQPGFSASSLDYKPNNHKGGPTSSDPNNSDKLLNPKPSKRKIQQPQQQDKQHQQQKQKPVFPTRAKGSSGPPPHTIATLEDLEHMSEDQLYRLFMDDPDLYRTLLKSTEEKRGRSTSAPPTGSQKARHTNQRKVHTRVTEDKEFPYLQWVVLVGLLGLGLYHLRSSLVTPVKQKRDPANVTGGVAKAKVGKQKRQKPKKAATASTNKLTTSGATDDDLFETVTKKKPTQLQPLEAPASTSKFRIASKKKKKQTRALENAQSVEDANIATAEISSTASEVASSATTEQPDGSANAASFVNEGEENNEESWQTVAKSRGNKTEYKEAKPDTASSRVDETNEAKETPNKLAPSNGSAAVAEQGVESTLDATTNHNGNSVGMSTDVMDDSVVANGALAANESTHNDPANKKKKKKKVSTHQSTKETTGTVKDQEPVPSPLDKVEPASMEVDAALALRLQKQEEDLAKAETENDVAEEEVWEEVTTRKKKG